MKPRKKYRPKPVNPTAYLLAMQGASLLSQQDRLERTNRLSAAVEVACMGCATREHWALIVDSLNMAEMFARHHVAAGLGEIYAMQVLVEEILNRQKATDVMIRQFYNTRGCAWLQRELLQSRTYWAIAARAQKLGVQGAKS